MGSQAWREVANKTKTYQISICICIHKFYALQNVMEGRKAFCVEIISHVLHFCYFSILLVIAKFVYLVDS